MRPCAKCAKMGLIIPWLGVRIPPGPPSSMLPQPFSGPADGVMKVSGESGQALAGCDKNAILWSNKWAASPGNQLEPRLVQQPGKAETSSHFRLRLSNYIKKREFSRARVLVFLGLAFCVFTWGLQYKLSLYDPPQAISHRAPQAKLLANDEPSRMAAVLRAIATEPTVRITIHGDGILPFLLLCLSVASLSLLAQEAPLTDASSHVRPALLSDLFVRPPPVQF